MGGGFPGDEKRKGKTTMSLHINDGRVSVYHPKNPCPHEVTEAEACMRLLVHEQLVSALIERVDDFWGDWRNLPQKYRDSFRRDYPDHPVMKAEQLLAEINAATEHPRPVRN
jgi:hypothetical protein